MNIKVNKKTPSLRALQKAGRSNPVVNFYNVFKGSIICLDCFAPLAITVFFLVCLHCEKLYGGHNVN